MRQEIYFHVGLGKVASTYLQQQVFPKLEGLTYISTHRYKKSKSILPKLQDQKVLVSREFDRQFEEEVRWFTKTYPQARIIMLLRRHDDWIASQYKRHVKNGFTGAFEAFLDLDKDRGFWKQADLRYAPKLKIIEECCEYPPLVLFYDELKQDPGTFLQKLTDYLGVALPQNISTKMVHTSYSEKQLKVLRAFTRRYIHDMPTQYQNKIRHWLLYRPVWIFYHLILYVASLFPQAWVPEEPLLAEEAMRKVRETFSGDWEQVKKDIAQME